MPESKSKFFIPAVGAAVVVAGSIAAYTYFKSPSGGSSDALDSAKVVPSTALMATYITTDSQGWAKLQQFGTPEAQKLGFIGAWLAGSRYFIYSSWWTNCGSDRRSQKSIS